MSADNVNMGPSAPGASRQRKSASSRGKYAPQACQECRRRRAKVARPAIIYAADNAFEGLIMSLT